MCNEHEPCPMHDAKARQEVPDDDEANEDAEEVATRGIETNELLPANERRQC